MKAMIFAAGKGTRLGKITQNIPKALLEISGKSALRHAVEMISGHGFDDIIVNIHHHPQLMMAEIKKLRSMGFRIEVSDETENLLETGGGLYKARWFFDDHNPFLLYNADIITDLNLTELYKFHRNHDGIATLAIINRVHTKYFLTDAGGIISGWRNTQTGDEIITRKAKPLRLAAFAGIHIVNPRIFEYMTDGVYSMTDLYLRISGENDIHTFMFDGNWTDIGSPESLMAARGEC